MYPGISPENAEKLWRVSAHISNPYRSDQQEVELQKHLSELKEAGVAVDVEPVARRPLEELDISIFRRKDVR